VFIGQDGQNVGRPLRKHAVHGRTTQRSRNRLI
jgi:hypothetical protein